MSKQTEASREYIRDSRVDVVAAYVDWITCVYHDEFGAAGRTKMLVVPNKVIPGLGTDVVPERSSWMGYSGFAANHMFWGTRKDETIIRASGEIAASVAREVPSYGLHVSRLDLALTAWFSEDRPLTALAARRLAVTEREGNSAPRKRKIRLQDGCGDGDTLYIGSRKSEQFGRLYDKGREDGSSTYKNAWRAEVEYHDDKAGGVFKLLRDVQFNSGTIAATVSAWWSLRGVDLPWYRGGDTPLVVRESGRHPDDASQLGWLEKQVAPCVSRLILRVGRDAVYSALFGGEAFEEFPKLKAQGDE